MSDDWSINGPFGANNWNQLLQRRVKPSKKLLAELHAAGWLVIRVPSLRKRNPKLHRALLAGDWSVGVEPVAKRNSKPVAARKSPRKGTVTR